MKKITISFKSTKRDEALFNIINNLDEKSFYIKEALRQYFQEEIKTELQKLEIAEKSTIDRRQKQQEIDYEDRRKSEYKYDEEMFENIPKLEEIKNETKNYD